jgi:hypothetical protein
MLILHDFIFWSDLSILYDLKIGEKYFSWILIIMWNLDDVDSVTFSHVDIMWAKEFDT